MNPSPILEEVAKKLKTPSEEIKIRRYLSGTSTAKVSEIRWEKDKVGILKQNTTKVEWLFYSKIANKHNVPAPRVIAFSDTSDVPWVLISKIYRGVHPKKWDESNIDRAIKEIARLHAIFYNKEDNEEFEEFSKPFGVDWEKTKKGLIENLDRASKIALNYKSKTPLTKTELDKTKKIIKSKTFLADFLASGTTLLHGDTWSYNFMQSSQCIACLFDWQESFIGPPAWEILYFYDLLPFHIDGIKISLYDLPFSFDEVLKKYFDELEINGVKLKKVDFLKSLKAAVSFQIAYQWAPRLKPDVLYLRGGRYFVARSLRLLPSRSEMREYFKGLLAISEKKKLF